MDLFYLLDAADSTLCEGILVPNVLFNVVSTIITGIKIVVPILLIIWGMLDFAKSVVAKKEEDIKKYQKAFVSRLISALVVFLIIFIVQLAVNLVSGVEDSSNPDGTTVSDIWSCSKKFINGVDTNTETEE
ncbi:unknown [Firmicutes bacterium CAG:822]|nr:unknown [Firmicutes bacterium CAG:822]